MKPVLDLDCCLDHRVGTDAVPGEVMEYHHAGQLVSSREAEKCVVLRSLVLPDALHETLRRQHVFLGEIESPRDLTTPPIGVEHRWRKFGRFGQRCRQPGRNRRLGRTSLRGHDGDDCHREMTKITHPVHDPLGLSVVRDDRARLWDGFELVQLEEGIEPPPCVQGLRIGGFASQEPWLELVFERLCPSGTERIERSSFRFRLFLVLLERSRTCFFLAACNDNHRGAGVFLLTHDSPRSNVNVNRQIFKVYEWRS